MARGIQRPGQTKEQTKLIAQGIQKGIDLYKRQQKDKARTLDKKLKQAHGQPSAAVETDIREIVRYRHHWLPWLLLALTWLGIGVYLSVSR